MSRNKENISARLWAAARAWHLSAGKRAHVRALRGEHLACLREEAEAHHAREIAQAAALRAAGKALREAARQAAGDAARRAQEEAQSRPLGHRLAAANDALLRAQSPHVQALRGEHLDLLWEQFRAQGGTP